MAMSDGGVTSSAGCIVKGIYAPQGVAGSLKDIVLSQPVSAEITALTYGTTSGKIDLITCSNRTLTAGASATYDLYTGTDLKDLAGNTCAFRKVKYIQISIVSGGDTSGLRIGGAAANIWVAFFADTSDKILIFPGGPALQVGSPAGVAVSNTNYNLKLENLGAVSVTFNITIAGTSV